MTRPPPRAWLFKSEPSSFSWHDLWTSPKRTTSWDGIRNHQARNLIRDEMRAGDRVLFYHSSATPPAVIGTAEIVRAAYPDPTAFDPDSDYFDPKSAQDEPTWYAVDLRAKKRFAHPVPLGELRTHAGLADMALLRKGNRLSVQPVTDAEFRIVERLGDQG